MAATSPHILLILLLCSQIIFINAVPLSRTRNLLHETETQEVVASFQGVTEDSWEEAVVTNGRMDLENTTNDYPGSGANSRHFPRPPLGRN
ncbi:hypothetical protein ACHQM5_006314 [Ranunculus cassubicifolius]